MPKQIALPVIKVDRIEPIGSETNPILAVE